MCVCVSWSFSCGAAQQRFMFGEKFYLSRDDPQIRGTMTTITPSACVPGEMVLDYSLSARAKLPRVVHCKKGEPVTNAKRSLCPRPRQFQEPECIPDTHPYSVHCAMLCDMPLGVKDTLAFSLFWRCQLLGDYIFVSKNSLCFRVENQLYPSRVVFITQNSLELKTY